MDVSGIQFNIIKESLNQDFFHFLRNGAEIRATVVKGGHQNETALLKAGRFTFQAKIENGSVEKSDKLFLRVLKSSDRIRLHILDKPGLQSALIEKGLDAVSLNLFVKFLGVFQNEFNIKKTGPVSDKKNILSRLKEIKKEIPDSLKEGISLLENLLESDAAENLLFEINFFTESEKNNAEDCNENEFKDAVYAGGSLKNSRNYLFTAFEFEKLGRLGVGIFSEDVHFTNLNICIVPYKKEISELLLSHKENIKGIFSSGVSVHHVEILNSSELSHIPLQLHA